MRASRLHYDAAAGGSVERGIDGVPRVAGDLERFIANFVEASPRRDSELFNPPTDAEREALLTGWRLIRKGEHAAAAELVQPLGMRVAHFTDEVGGSRHVMMYEALGTKEATSRGHGLFVYRRDAAKGAAHIQVPHPWDDIATDSVGARTYLDSGARTLAVAGASRWSLPNGVSDAAHSQASFFHAISEVHAQRGARLVQLHGFNQQKNPAYYGQSVVSTGDVPTPEARAMHQALVDNGIDAKLYTGEGKGPNGTIPYVNLGARHNVQGIHARKQGAKFVHVELGNSLRMESTARARSVAALVDGIRRSDPAPAAAG